MVGHAEHAGDLRRFLTAGKKIIITTVQKFPFILDEIGDEHRGRKFAHHHRRGAFQPGRRTAAKMNMALSAQARTRSEETTEDLINRIMESRKMLTQRQLLRVHCDAEEQDAGDFRRAVAGRRQVKHRPFHSYTMKQAIQEGFILDVLQQLHARRTATTGW